MKRYLLSILPFVAALLAVSCSQTPSETDRLNKQAIEEYTRPVRPGNSAGVPYWNKFAAKFMYAPAFDFKEYEGAAKYRYTVYLESQTYERLPNQKQGREDNFFVPKHIPNGAPHWSFCEDTPRSSLSPIWNELPQGYMDLVVEALDKKGNVIATVGTRRFLRDFPFVAPGKPAARDYYEAAMLALKYIHNSKYMKSWRNSNEADMSMAMNSYVCKIIGSSVQLEAMVAKYIPEYREEALGAARNAADYLMRNAFPDSSALAHFPPTYKGMGNEAAKPENQISTMIMEAIYPAVGYLDLYDQTQDKIYLDEAEHIANTFVSLQQEDGSLPKKVYYATGEPIVGGAMLGKILQFVKRLKNQYGMERFNDFILKGEKWMAENPLETFDFTPQFEDVAVTGWEPYEDFTNCTAATYVSYLLEDGAARTGEEILACKEILAVCEDQLVFWDSLKSKDGGVDMPTPCVMEQFTFRVPIDDSACNMANGWLDYYNATGDKLALAKCTAMVNALTNVQVPETGLIPTGWYSGKADGCWTNCLAESIKMLLRYHEQFGDLPEPQIESLEEVAGFKDYDVYLAIGDGGMAGKGYMYSGDSKPVAGVALLNPEGVPVVARNPFNQYSSVIADPSSQLMSPAYSFAKTIHEKTGRRILLVVNACDLPIVNGWQKDSVLFKEAIRRAEQAKEFGHIKGILWYNNASESDDVYGRFQDFVIELREALGTQDIPFIAALLPEWLDYAGGVNDSIKYSAMKTRYLTYASAEWLVWRDKVKDENLNRISNIWLGERFADRMLEMSRFVVAR